MSKLALPEATSATTLIILHSLEPPLLCTYPLATIAFPSQFYSNAMLLGSEAYQNLEGLN